MIIQKKHIIFLEGVVIIALAVVVTWLYLTLNQRSDGAGGTVNAVSRHYQLPEEDPAIATVEDKTKLNSEFLKNAENGDKLLIYKDAKKVILYRPSVDRIIEVGPVSIASPKSGTTSE